MVSYHVLKFHKSPWGQSWNTSLLANSFFILFGHPFVNFSSYSCAWKSQPKWSVLAFLVAGEGNCDHRRHSWNFCPRIGDINGVSLPLRKMVLYEPVQKYSHSAPVSEFSLFWECSTYSWVETQVFAAFRESSPVSTKIPNENRLRKTIGHRYINFVLKWTVRERHLLLWIDFLF